jgi:hypothetical protein
MAIDQVSTPVLHLPNIDVGLVNTRLVFFFQFTFIFTQFPIEQQSRKINNHFSFYTVLRCRAFLRFITHNISNLTPEDQMIAYIPSSTLAPTRARQRPFWLRSVFNDGHTLSPMSPKYVIFSLFVIRSAAAWMSFYINISWPFVYSFGVLPLDSSSDASQSSMVFLCPAPPLGETNDPKSLPKRVS